MRLSPPTAVAPIPIPIAFDSLAVALRLALAGLVLCSSVRALPGEPLPLAVPAAADWIGYDGSWNPVAIRVGSPPQWINVFPNTGSSETWVIGRAGCDGTVCDVARPRDIKPDWTTADRYASLAMECRTERGGLFLSNQSSTWQDVGFYELGDTVQLGRRGVGYYGFDNISMDSELMLAGQIVSILNITDWWIGSLGLGIKQTSFTSDDKLSFVGTLAADRKLIPSHSYGYTAGAYYQSKGMPSSLTLGGFDTSRFLSNDVTFALSSDNLPVVAFNSIKVSTSRDPLGSSLLELSPLQRLDLYKIDSSTPFFWLPEYLCDAFAKQLGLTYNDTLQLYTYGSNSSPYDNAMNSNVSVTFTICDLPGSRKTVDITLPFSAFDHKLSYPFPKYDANVTSQSLRYFPLRKALDPKQFTLGRAFLQEAYLTVDYERRNFSVSQAQFPSDAETSKNLVAIPHPLSAIYEQNPRSSLSPAAASGIGVGVAAIAIIATWGIVVMYKKRKKTKESNKQIPEKRDQKNEKRSRWKFWRSSNPSPPSELLGDEHFATEAPSDPSVTRFELQAPMAPVELEASEITNPLYSASGKRRDIAIILPAYETRNVPTSSGEIAVPAATLTTGPPVYIFPYAALDTSDGDSELVSPLAPTLSTFNDSNSGEAPSPLTPSGSRSFRGFIPHAMPPPSVSPTEEQLSSTSPGTTANGSQPEGAQGPGEPMRRPRTPPRVLRRKFSWEE
ncbi:hypothetical protein LOZ66_005628 [Ophidiomyces ophidiicola]|nr:hypothetical protein LOZ66_005628 [Ophidiomyces ophidiicola]